MTVRAVVTASGRVDVRRHRATRPRARSRATAAARSTARSALELERALAVADRANNAVLQERDGRWTVQGDPTEGALIVAARKAGLSADALDARFRARRRGAVLLRAQADEHGPHATPSAQERLLVFTKGAPDVLLARCIAGARGRRARGR